MQSTDQFRSEFDAYAENYKQDLSHFCRRFVDPKENYFVDLKCAELHRLVRGFGHTPADLVVADIGCGIGDFERRLMGGFKHLLAFDLSLKMIQVAQRIAPLPQSGYVCANSLTLPLADNSVDVAFASCMLHHMPTDTIPAVIHELRRVCRPGGLVICFEHNPFNPVTQLVVRTTPIDKTATLLTSGALRRVFVEAALEEISLHYLLFGPQAIEARLARYQPWLRRTPLGAQYMIAGRKGQCRPQGWAP